MAFRTSRTSTVRGRPPRFAGRINGATSNHSASVRSLSYRRPRRSAAARWSGFHMRHLSPTQVPHKESKPIPETQLLSGWALRRVLRLARRSRHYLRLDHVLRPGDGTSEEWDLMGPAPNSLLLGRAHLPTPAERRA